MTKNQKVENTTSHYPDEEPVQKNWENEHLAKTWHKKHITKNPKKPENNKSNTWKE